MKNIVITNNKGGPGKTTVTMCLAALLAAAKRHVRVIDLDPQASTRVWWPVADAEFMHQGPCAEADVTLTDTPPNIAAAGMGAALKAADLVILVAEPSLLDCQTTQLTADYLKRNFPKIPLRLLFNKVSPKTKSAEAIPDFAKSIGVSRFDTSLQYRQCYKRVTVEGWPAIQPGARTELTKLALEIFV